jgi:hypothetical protein
MYGTRRDFLLSSGLLALLPPAARAALTWVDKKPSEWSPKDIQTILNQSPWVRDVVLELNAAAATGAAGTPAARSDSRGKAGGMVDYKVVVRWESGLPVRLARRTPPATYNGVPQYLLSVGRVPIAFASVLSGGKQGRKANDETDRAALSEQILKSSTLQREGRTPIRAVYVDWVEADFESRILISFPREPQPIELADREVTLVGQIGPLLVRAPFLVDKMQYRGNLEL